MFVELVMASSIDGDHVCPAATSALGRKTRSDRRVNSCAIDFATSNSGTPQLM